MTTETLDLPVNGNDSALVEAASPAIETTAIALVNDVQTSVQKLDALKRNLPELHRKYRNVVYPVSSKTGMAEAKLARAEIRAPRISVSKVITEGKQRYDAGKRAFESVGLETLTEYVGLESPIDEQIKAEEAVQAAAKAARDAEAAAAAAVVQAKIDALRTVVVDAAGKTASEIMVLRESLVDPVEISLEVFGDRAGEAMQVKSYTVAKLDELHATAVAQEAAQANLALVQKELADMRAANDAREAEARATAAAAQALEAERLATAAAKLEADRAAFAAEQRAAREAEEARAATARKAEDDRIAAERKAEQERIDEEQRLQREAAAAEQARLDQEAAAARAEAARIAEEARAAEEAAQAAHQKVRNAAHELLAALQRAIPFIGYEGAGDQEAKEAAYAAVILATGEEA